jgi:DNA-binding transcriptional LysR family regulator
MTRRIDWGSRIGRRLRLRDLHVFFSVVQCGSMGKAAVQLGVSQPTVSEAIADLEQTFGVRLFDRSPQGVEPTSYGFALLKRAVAAFDELRQSGQDIEFLSDPTVGELLIGCSESISSAILPPIIHQFSQKYPRVTFDVGIGATDASLNKLRNRHVDLVLSRPAWGLPADGTDKELNVSILFQDELVVAAGADNPLTRRRTLDLADLVNERWILTAPDYWSSKAMAEAFRARGLSMPIIAVKSLSIPLRTKLVATGEFITALPRSNLVLEGSQFPLKALPVDLASPSWPVTIVTLKGRTVSPLVERFVECARQVTRPLTGKSRARTTRMWKSMSG